MDSKTIQFGKHRGKTFKAVFDTDRGYVKWILDQPPSTYSSNFNEFQNYAREKLRNADPTANLRKTGPITHIVNSWNFEAMIKQGLLPDIHFPESSTLHERHGQPLIFGVFIGYLMRRMIHEANDEPISERLICELGLRNAGLIVSSCIPLDRFENWLTKKEREVMFFSLKYDPTSISEDKIKTLLDNSQDRLFSDLVLETKSIEKSRRNAIETLSVSTETDSFRNSSKFPADQVFKYADKIKAYKNLNKSWQEVLRETWDICQLDRLYREHGLTFDQVNQEYHYTTPAFNYVPIPDELLNPEYSLYQYMETVANSFYRKSIRYNPTLGFGRVKADAQLIVDETLVQFKIAVDPALTRDVAQCYCYKILADKHNIPIREIKIYYLLHETVISPTILDLTTIKERYLDFGEEN